jgi:2'-5' RNA ligase
MSGAAAEAGAAGGGRDDDVLRAFVALEIGEDLRAALGDVQRRLRKAEARVAWVAPGNVHLTLVFLGDVFRAQVRALAPRLDEAAAGVPAFAWRAGRPGSFGRPGAPRVLWVGVDPVPQALLDLRRRVAEAVAAGGLPVEARPFAPHLTIGRVRGAQGADRLTALLASSTTVPAGAVEARRVRLMRSILNPGGAAYSVLHESSLKGA